jgi:hypothetical protein
MRALGLLPVLLLTLVPGQFAFGADPGVTLTICNAGKVDVDAYLVRQSSTLTTHIAPAKCGVLEKVEGSAKPGIVGFGFTDTKGQWGGVRRTEVWPDSIGGVFEPVKQTLTVRHGAANENVTGLVSYTSATPYCAPAGEVTMSVPTPQYPGQKVAPIAAPKIDPTKGPLVCHDMAYDLTVIPYADSHELAFDSHCYPCETPVERAAAEEAEAVDPFNLASMPGVGGIIGKGIVNLTQAGINQEKQERARRAEIDKGPYHMNWKDLSSFYSSAFGVSGRPPLMANRHIILHGTVSRVQTPNPGAQTPWVYAFFKDISSMEKPIEGLPGDYSITSYVGKEQAFGICSTDPGIFSEVFGANYGTAMVGKTVEMEGELNNGTCGTAAGIKVTLARQLKVVTPGMPMATGQTWTPKPRLVQPSSPSAAATPVAVIPAAPASQNQEEIARVAASRAATLNRNTTPPSQPARNPEASPVPAATASVSPARLPPAPAPAAPAATVRDPLINNVISLLKAKSSEMQIMLMLKQRNRPLKLTGADRGELEDAGASEKLINAMMDPASIGPEVTPEAAAAAAKQNTASQRGQR